MIGSRLGHYTIESRIGEGGMGEVYRARDTRLDRSVAIKLLAAGSEQRGENLRRFIQEAKTASSLNHPNIVTIHEIGEDASVPFIVMEHIDGAPLSRAMDAPMALDRFFDYAIQISSALGAAHQAGVVHRDIKPGNVMLTSSGLIKVVDFGLARLSMGMTGDHEAPTAKISGSAPMTAPGVILGTVGYMSPEQVEGVPADSRSDVFSFGVLLHEMLSGRPAFRATSVIATLSAILRDDPSPISSVRRDIPPALVRLVARCMAKNPEARPASAGEVHQELQRIHQSLAEDAHRSWLRRPVIRVLLGLAAVALLALTTFWWRRDSRLRWVRNEAIPEIERLAAAENIDGAYRLARRAREISPDDPQLGQLWVNLTIPARIASDPPGAIVEFKTYSAPEGSWLSMGTTPTASINIPLALVRFRLRKDGYVPLDVAPEIDSDPMTFTLHQTGSIPPRMVMVKGGSTEFQGRTVDVPEFQIDQFEVTNREFRQFVDAGGYRRRDLWKHPIRDGARTLTWEAAMAAMTDKTGRPGPATWELGSYLEGEGEHPVDGVSWYEAAAYAEFAGKRLPTVYHWSRAATDRSIFADMLTSSNFEMKELVPVGSKPGLGPFGTYDMAGNVKEWCANAIDQRKFILGGAFFEARYQHLEADAQPPLARRRGAGFRLIKERVPAPASLAGEVVRAEPAIASAVDDATFAAYARLFDYDPLPLQARTEERDDAHESWLREKVSFTAAYGNERIPVYLFLPRNARPPYQTIVYFPGSDATFIKSSRNLWLRMVDFYVKSGRAVVYPVYKGTYERGVPAAVGPVARRELRVQRVKDIRRVVDYVATRPDLDSSRLLYYGLSLGVSQAPCALAVEPRFKAAVFLAGGLSLGRVTNPEIAARNYLPRVKLPVLLINGRYDFEYPYETSQKPFFQLLGTRPEDKRHVVLDGGHLPLQYTELVKEMLSWADARLGPVVR